jgi:hypothetical protein
MKQLPMDNYCPDGMDCDKWCICHDDDDQDECPLVTNQYDRTTPVDKLMERW